MKHLLVLLPIIIGLCISPITSYAHPMLSEQVMDFIWSNPRATDAEIDAFLQANPEQNVDDTREMMTMFRDLTDEQLQDVTGNRVVTTEPAVTKGVLNRFIEFIRQGVLHIVLGPDHVLFVLSLLLMPIGFKALLRIVTTFTIAHCCTFLLAGLGILTVPASIVEPIIALSIMYVALTSVFFGQQSFFGSAHNKLLIIFIFGLFHGLGFASVFTDLGIQSSNFIVPLLGFNLGIEIGQLCIIGLAIPVLDAVRKLPGHTRIIQASAIAMSTVALLWFIERI